MRTDATLSRRHCLGLALAAAWVGPARAQGSPGGEPPRLAFLGFELIDEQPDPSRAAALRQRLAMIGQQMAEGLAAKGLYRVLDLTPARAALDLARERNEYLYRCNGCLTEVAAALDGRLVATGWVQRVSGLILNINLQVQDVTDDRQALTRSVDIRGDNDDAWRRGVAYLLRDIAERRERQPGYGR